MKNKILLIFNGLDINTTDLEKVKQWFIDNNVDFSYDIMIDDYPYKLALGQEPSFPLGHFIDIYDLKNHISNLPIDEVYDGIFVVYNRNLYPSDWLINCRGYSWFLHNAFVGEIATTQEALTGQYNLSQVFKHEFLHNIYAQLKRRGFNVVDRLHELEAQYGVDGGQQNVLKSYTYCEKCGKILTNEDYE
jgi:hypothetical protein